MRRLLMLLTATALLVGTQSTATAITGGPRTVMATHMWG